MWDYYNHTEDVQPSHAKVYYTDGGRKVYGGGGITPDVEFQQPKLNNVQQRLLARNVFFDFSKSYLADHKDVSEDFEPNDAVVQDFKKYLRQEGISLSDKDFVANLNFIKLRIKENVIGTAFGEQEEQRIAAENDPLVEKAIQELPEAAQLVENAKRYMASRHTLSN